MTSRDPKCVVTVRQYGQLSL